MNDLTESYAAKVAAYLGAPNASSRVYQIMNNWTPFEWSASYGGPRARYNPLAITTKTDTSTPLGGNPGQNNGTPVQNYTSEDEGARLTAQFLLNGRYPDIVNWMKTGNLDKGKVAQQVRTWGTTGFANQIDGGGGNVSNSSTSSANSGGYDPTQHLQSSIDFWEKRLQDLQTKEPSQDDLSYGVWAADVKNAGTILATLYGRASQFAGRENQAGQLGVSQQNADTAAQNAETASQGEARNRAKLVQDATDQLTKYGAPQGKTSFSSNDLGSASQRWAGLLGIDPSASALNYTGQVAVDPYGDLARMDKARLGGGASNGGMPPPGPPATGNTATGTLPPNPQGDPLQTGPNIDTGLGGMPPVRPSSGMLPGGRDDWNMPPALAGQPRDDWAKTPPPWHPPDYQALFRRLSAAGRF